MTTKSTRELASTLANRDKNVVLLVETTNCRYCEQVEPTFAAMAAMFAGDESIEVQRVVCKTPEQKAFAGEVFSREKFSNHLHVTERVVGRCFATRVRTGRLELFWSSREKRPARFQTPAGVNDTRTI